MALKIKKNHITHYSSSFARFLKQKKTKWREQQRILPNSFANSTKIKSRNLCFLLNALKLVLGQLECLSAENDGHFLIKILLLKQLKSDWFLLVSFVFSANQKPFVICTRVTSFALVLQVCTRVTSLHLCYRRTALLSQAFRIGQFFRVYYFKFNSCAL